MKPQRLHYILITIILLGFGALAVNQTINPSAPVEIMLQFEGEKAYIIALAFFVLIGIVLIEKWRRQDD